MTDDLASDVASPLAGLRARARRLTDDSRFTRFISVVIAINAVTLGLETWPEAMAGYGDILYGIDRAALAIFVVEILLKLFGHGGRFFKSGWNVFDFIIVGIALMPASGAFSVLRALRILRALRLLSVVPQMRAVVEALLAAVPGMGAIIAVLGLVFYIAAVMATKLFAAQFPDWFGSVGASMYSLFQIMTLESWSMGIVRPVMEVYGWAWAFFVPFIIVTSFAVLNLFIALIVNSLQMINEASLREATEEAEHHAHDEREAMMHEIRALRGEVSALRQELKQERAGE